MTSTWGERPTIICFGDSITQQGFREGGWLCLLAEWYEQKADILNRGFSGYNTKWALEVAYEKSFGSWQERPTMVIMCFGANDASTDGQHVPLDDYQANLKALVARLRGKWPRLPVLLVTCPPVCDAKYSAFCLATHGAEATRWLSISQRYAEACVSVYHQLEQEELAELSADAEQDFSDSDFLGVLDLFATEEKNGIPAFGREDELFTDGLHLTPFGNKRFFECIRAAIQLYFPSLASPSLPPAFPHWSKLVGNDNKEQVCSSQLAPPGP